MKQTLQEFKEAVTALDTEITDYYKPFETESRSIISDGVVNEEEYYNASPKIMWILKEPYDDGDDIGGGWSLTKDLLALDNVYERLIPSRSTWRPIMYSTWGIMNGYLKWDSIPDLKDKPDIGRILRKIAFINVQKLAASTKSYDPIIREAYHENKEILLKQIEVYNPDIIIGGSVLPFFFKDLGLTDAKRVVENNDYTFISNGKLYINSYHPSQTQETHESFCSGIIQAAKDWHEKSTIPS